MPLLSPHRGHVRDDVSYLRGLLLTAVEPKAGQVEKPMPGPQGSLMTAQVWPHRWWWNSVGLHMLKLFFFFWISSWFASWFGM